ncbi:MAG: YidB family protein [Burkholderiaceae bacterium]
MSSILGSIASQVLGSLAGQNATGASPITAVLGQLLASNGPFGGMAGLTQQLQQAGLGDQLSSWISTGPNLPVSADQLSQAFGGERLAQLASAAGIEPQALSQGLAQALPQAVDQLTPSGQLPSASGLDAALAGLSQLLKP